MSKLCIVSGDILSGLAGFPKVIFSAFFTSSRVKGSLLTPRTVKRFYSPRVYWFEVYFQAD